MCILLVLERFPTERSCYEFLEEMRYKDNAFCPYCASVNVAKKKERKKLGRWNCHDCNSSFRVTQGTLFQGTKIPLQKWFLGIVLIANAKKSLSSCQLARDLGMNQKSAWYMMVRVRAEMASKNDVILQGIIEADETYVGGKPMKGEKRDDDPDNPTGGWSKKTPVLGVVERGGKVVAKAVRSVTAGEVLNFLLFTVDTRDSTLMTDENNVYQNLDRFIKHRSVNHSGRYVDRIVHTNTLEGFWSLLKRAWYGKHHKYSKSFLPLYIAEAVWKYNNRNESNPFDFFIRGCFA